MTAAERRLKVRDAARDLEAIELKLRAAVAAIGPMVREVERIRTTIEAVVAEPPPAPVQQELGT